ncbi:RimK/LysX family protein [Akkermansiaceae bacterium]|nr:RimK/LysX family protein [Akkermansiaceae bacterium]
MKKAKLLIVALACLSLSTAEEKKKIIVGYIEKISIPALDMVIKAKLDTGATTSSIHAEIIEEPKKEKKGEKQYITFTIQTEEGASKKIKKEITRWVAIKKKDGGTQQRPVVMMEFCIAGELVKEEVNLANRDNFIYDVLIGRNMLTKGNILIDSNLKFSSKPNCPTTKEKE